MRREDDIVKIKRNNSNRNGCTGDWENELSGNNFKIFNRGFLIKT